MPIAPPRRALARRALLAAPLALPAAAQTARPVRLLVGFPPSAIPDLVSRILAPALTEALGQPVVVENRPGAGGALAAEALLRAPADGQTLMMMAQYLPVLPAVQRHVPFDVGDVLPLAGTAQAPLVLLVPPGLGVRDLAGFLALARARGESLPYGHSGLASAPNLAMALLRDATGIAPLAVAYKGEPEILNGLLTGAVECGFGFLAGASAQIRGGRLQGLGITAAGRAALLPAVPDFAELGLPAVRIGAWWAVAVPRATPPAVQARITGAVRAVRSMPETRARLGAAGCLPLDLEGAALAAFTAVERDRQLGLFRRLGVQPE
ncbi:tripartite tricarboxylate transporter substrate binding protein [Paracraurococcus lichenis]|uniref:Tripartite tricarboxylate transporter substrate binding protein n=1 Tax=Paracraurococcus lichenis TaxID=3064888 RepID=A0ABT9DZJ4_9PROT|nr:tripartite tricarboxylate transporter substrate binding protein [Paracraurococcus sp. LOR1-02]MDO9709310.1 tripartite tricarboxylate transporter substrate binding protein [Paracraurococcus sp. LOR1-02]